MLGFQLSIRAARAPADPAVAFGPRRLDYGTLEARACRLAQALAAAGIRRGDRVAALMNNCPQFLEALFATVRLGAIFVPVNFRLAPPEIVRLVAACTPSILLAGQDFDTALAELAAGGLLPPHVVRVNVRPDLDASDAPYEDWLAAHPPTAPDIAVAAEEPALMMHSSGTTGLPKGAIHTHGTAMSSCMAKIIDFGLGRNDRAVVFGPLFHAGPLMDLALPLLMRGGSVVLGASRNFDAQILLETIARERGTAAPVYPTMLRRVMAADLTPHDLSSLRLIITGGEPVTEALLTRVQHALPGTEVINNYGSTEGGPITTFLHAEDAARKPGSVGLPAFGMDLRIADEAGRELPAGSVGEILVRGPFTCRGYWNRPDLTEAATVNGWWRTGDLAHRDAEGFLWIDGRRKDMIKTGTENVYPTEVEEVIAALPYVAEVGVVGVPDDDLGEAVAAFIVSAPGAPEDPDAILSECRRQLAGYKKPRHVRFVAALPRTTVNKISKDKLRAWFAAEGS